MSGSLATEQATLQQNANTYGSYGGHTPGTISLSPGDLYPGSGGSVTDAQGNVFTLTQMDGLPNFGWITENGEPVPNGDYTAALTESNGTIYAEDGKGGDWYTFKDGQFVAASDPGDTSGTSNSTSFSGSSSTASSGGNSTVDTTGASSGATSNTAAANNVSSSSNAVGANTVDAGTASNQSSATSSSNTASSSDGGSTTNTITPGHGSFTGPTPDGGTGTYSIDPNGDVADLNGQPITSDGGSSGTGVLQLTADQMVVGQDESSGNWFQLVSKGATGLFEWQSTSAPAGASASTSTTTAPAASSSASMQFISSNTSGVATTDFTQSCVHGG